MVLIFIVNNYLSVHNLILFPVRTYRQSNNANNTNNDHFTIIYIRIKYFKYFGVNIINLVVKMLIYVGTYTIIYQLRCINFLVGFAVTECSTEKQIYTTKSINLME